MARNGKVSDYGDWNEVDQGLRRMGEIDIKLASLEGDMTLKIHTVRAEFDAKPRP